jgi:hypothetical protein
VRQTALPFAAAIGGVLMPALLYLAIVPADARGGWAITATIAFALGVLFRPPARQPTSRFLALAIVDDAVRTGDRSFCDGDWQPSARRPRCWLEVAEPLGVRIWACLGLAGAVVLRRVRRARHGNGCDSVYRADPHADRRRAVFGGRSRHPRRIRSPDRGSDVITSKGGGSAARSNRQRRGTAPLLRLEHTLRQASVRGDAVFA